MTKFFKELYENKYHLKAPKITRVKDGVYIYSEGGKIFINEVDFNESPEFYNTYLENVDDRIIRAMEKRSKNSDNII